MFRDWVNPSVSLVKGGEACKWSLMEGSWMMFCERIVLVVFGKGFLKKDRTGLSHFSYHVTSLSFTLSLSLLS